MAIFQFCLNFLVPISLLTYLVEAHLSYAFLLDAGKFFSTNVRVVTI